MITKKFGLMALLVVLAGAVFGGIFGNLPVTSSADATLNSEKIVADYREALGVIDNNYVGKIDHEKVSESSIQSMLWTLDPHSAFFTRDEFRKLYEDQSSQFYGIGVSILQHRDGVYISSIIPNTPADKAGLRYGDKFVQIDGKDAKKYTSAEVSKNVRGERGTPVNIKVERPGSETLNFDIVRGGVPLPSIRNHFMLKDNIGYVALSGGFQETTADELDKSIADLKKQGMKSLVLDLRGNPGGLLPQSIEVVSRFISSGQTVVSVKGRSGYAQSKDLRSSGRTLHDFPLVVMINGSSASASEIVAGAIQDYGRGMVVGTDSFGKGLVQRVFPLPLGAGLTLTTARYYTPYGRSLQKDYSGGSIYDYYTNNSGGEEEGPGKINPNVKPKPAGSPVTTAGGRVFNSGRGIEPDIKATPLALTPLRFRINEAAFFFVRQLISGQMKGLESYKVGKQNFNLTIQPNDLQITDKILEAFRVFAVKDKDNGLTIENINSQLEFAKTRLRQELAIANYSSEAGQQVLTETDPQVLKAIEAVPEAQKLLGNFQANKR
ncbi:MAG: S41 family peptidase [Acidobacteria bacterium]|jgi:carboxyl-terminal processing protease|nr:S41 family peptidase [Acidobacteriota bacterium]